MNIEQQLRERSGSICELCGSPDKLEVYTIPPAEPVLDKSILLCNTCLKQIQDSTKISINHWRCLNNSMWSTVPAVQVMVWRLLYSMRQEGWTQDLLDILYLEEETLAWAKESIQEDGIGGEKIIHKDSNGAILQTGDTVVLIKDLDVKGGGFTAKRGTSVKGILLVEDNPGQIEGKVSGQQIVILTQFVKKSL